MSYYYDSNYDSDSTSDGEPYLHLKEYVREGNYTAVKESLDDGGNPNDVYSNSNYTILHWAAGMTDEDNLEEVRATKYKISDRRKIVKLLLEHEAKAWSIWWQRQFFGHHYGKRPWNLTDDQVTRKLIQEACVKQVLTIIHEKVNKYAYTEKSGGLIAASILNSSEAINKICEAGADVNASTCDITALGEACRNGNLEAATILVNDFGAKIDDDMDQNGTTALFHAATCGHSSLVEFLLQKGANPLSEKIGLGPIPMSAESRIVIDTLLAAIHLRVQNLSYETETLPKCLELKCRNSQTCAIFESALHVFIAFGYNEGIYTLLDKGISLPSNSLQTAVAFGQTDSLELLLAEGALKNYSGYDKVCFYGPGSRRPSKSAVDECQKRLDETCAASLE